MVPPDASAGWYQDPWQQAVWRWWDGSHWTALTSAARSVSRPRLPGWLSTPVIVCGLIQLPLLALVILMNPIVVPFVLFPLVFLLPLYHWLDRVEPEPLASRVHALAWGALVATFVAGLVNFSIGLDTSTTVAAVISAPLIEETMKGLGVLWAVRRNEVDSVMDGVVYAGWVAIGFALVENVEYYSAAWQQQSLVQVFVLRGVLTPFLHPLFTVWTGVAIGRAVARRVPLATSWYGWLAAIAAHAGWNGAASVAEDGSFGVLLVAIAVFVVILGVTAVAVVSIRSRERSQFLEHVPELGEAYGIDPSYLAAFTDWRALLRTRRQLPRARRRAFDAVHAALARLALLHARPGPIDPAVEARLGDQLERAWRTGRR